MAEPAAARDSRLKFKQYRCLTELSIYICFNCPYCGYRYTGGYIDHEIRQLQMKIQQVQKRFGDKRYNKEVVIKQEKKIKQEISNKMDGLRKKIEDAAAAEQGRSDE